MKHHKKLLCSWAITFPIYPRAVVLGMLMLLPAEGVLGRNEVDIFLVIPWDILAEHSN